MGNSQRKLTYYLDTNVYRRLAREGRKIGSKGFALSHVSLAELILQLQSCSNDELFKELKQALEIAREHCKRKMLPEPTDVIRCSCLGEKVVPSRSCPLKKALEVAVRIRSLEELDLPVKIGIESRAYRLRALDIGRHKLQKEWAAQIQWAKRNFLDKHDVPAAVKTPDTNLATGEFAKWINRWFLSEEWRNGYASGILGVLGKLEGQSPRVLAAAKALDAAAVFVGSILRAVIVDGYRFDRNLNDALDHKQLQYLCRHDLIFVTDDNPLRFRVSSSFQQSRILSLDEFIGTD